ncbi:MAG: hypothetical protein ACI9RU_000770 [Litorivivens sp.]|jgi:hypothetical protein
MKRIYALVIAAIPSLMFGQTFTNATNELPDAYNSGGCVGVTDMDQNGYDDIIILDGSSSLKIVYQDNMGNFNESVLGMVSGNSQWGMAIGDIENNGHNDVFCGGAYDGVHLMSITSEGNYNLSDLEEGDLYMQGCNIADIDNDGWLDAFACHDDAESRIWGNNGSGSLVPQNGWIDMASTPVTDNSGNYGSVWTDFDRDGDIDLFIAKCRQFVSDPYDARRINTLWVNDGSSNYSDVADDRGLVLYEQSWTSDFADIDNDGDFDCLITNHSTTLTLLENDGMGYFTDITAGSGLEINNFFLQAKMVDFDNDGFVDLIYAGGSEGFLHNNGDQTFTLMEDVFPYDGDELHSFGIGDLNHDGQMDVYGSYGDGYVSADYDHDDALWLNDGNENNWITFQLEGTESNINAIGAKVIIYGDFGSQIREVRSGESYGIVNTFNCHFGLGTSTIDYAVVEWPSGQMTLLENPDVNDFVQVVEGACTAEEGTISASGSIALCDGETVDISIDDESLSWVWSNGDTGSTINISEQGAYHAVVWGDNDCPSYTNTIFVSYFEPVAPTVAVSGDLEFCEGGSVQLIGSDGMSWDWSNGEDTQAITVTESGTYSVSVQGDCDAPLSSEIIEVVTLVTPASPVVTDVELDVAGNAEFTGTSENMRWYETEMAATPLAEGTTFTTSWIDVTTSYWVEDVMYHGGEEGNGGPATNDEGQHHFNSGFYLNFDANEDIIIESVRVYANGVIDREIAVVDQFGSVVSSGIFTIPDGESIVEINLSVPAGEGYGLRSMDDDPQLWRDANTDTDMDFPFAVGDLASITGTNVTGDNWNNYYYFFYDWTVSTPLTECVSERVEVIATIVGVEEIAELASLEMYPNPADDQLTLAFNLVQSATIQINMFDQVGKLVVSENLAQQGVGALNHIINLENVEAGVYHMQFIVNGKSVSEKVIVR